MLSMSTCSTVSMGLTTASNAMELRYKRPPSVSHVYSTYVIRPLPLMSPTILSSSPVDPFAVVVGMTPATNPPGADTCAPAACAKANVAVIVSSAASTAVTVTVSSSAPVSITNCSPTNMPSVEGDTATVTPTPAAAAPS